MLSDKATVHWMPILQTLLINVILAAIIWHIIRRNVGSDIKRYNEVRLNLLVV